MNGNNSSYARVDYGPTSLTSINKIAEPSSADAKCIGDTLVNKGINSSYARVDYGPTSLTSINKIAEPSSADAKCIGDTLVNKGTEAPNPPPVEVRILSSTAGALPPTGTASRALWAIFLQLFFVLELR